MQTASKDLRGAPHEGRKTNDKKVGDAETEAWTEVHAQACEHGIGGM